MNYIIAQNGSIIPMRGPIWYKTDEDKVKIMSTIDNRDYELAAYSNLEIVNRVIGNMVENMSIGVHWYSMPVEKDTEKTED